MFPVPSVPFVLLSFYLLPIHVSKNISTLHSSGNDPMDVDVGNTSSDQDVPAERLLHNLQI
jgi:hypothetical protein